MLYLLIVGEDMKGSRKKQKKPQKNNIVFIVIIAIILLLIIALSLKTNSKNNGNIFTFNSTEFANISVIGIGEYQASLNFNGTSIIFFCSNEEKSCYEELKELDEIAKKHSLIIEYINILELVDSEKEILASSTDIFNENYYPHLVIIENGNIISDSNKYLNGNEIKEILKKHKIIK
jgi:hypothetical protein